MCIILYSHTLVSGVLLSGPHLLTGHAPEDRKTANCWQKSRSLQYLWTACIGMNLQQNISQYMSCLFPDGLNKSQHCIASFFLEILSLWGFKKLPILCVCDYYNVCLTESIIQRFRSIWTCTESQNVVYIWDWSVAMGCGWSNWKRAGLVTSQIIL